MFLLILHVILFHDYGVLVWVHLVNHGVVLIQDDSVFQWRRLVHQQRGIIVIRLDRVIQLLGTRVRVVATGLMLLLLLNRSSLLTLVIYFQYSYLH